MRTIVSILAIVPYLTASANAGMLIDGLSESAIRLRENPERSASYSFDSMVPSDNRSQENTHDHLLDFADHSTAQQIEAAIPGGVRRLDVKSGSITNVVNEDIAYGASLLVSADSRLVIAPDQHKERIRVYDEEKRILNEYSFDSDVQDLRFAGDGTAFVLVSNRQGPQSRPGGVRRLDLTSGQITNVFDADIKQGASLLAGPKGAFIMAPSQHDNRVKVLDERGRILSEHFFQQNVQDLQLADDGRVFVLVSNEPTVCGHDCGGGVRKLDLATGCIESVLCADVGQGANLLVAAEGGLLIAPSQYDNRVRVYEPTGRLLSEHEFPNSVQDLQFSADGSVLALVNPAEVETSAVGIGLGGGTQLDLGSGFLDLPTTATFGSSLGSSGAGFVGAGSGGPLMTSSQPGGGTGMFNGQGRFPSAIQQAGGVQDPLVFGSHLLTPNPMEFDDGELDPSDTETEGSVSAVPEPSSFLLLLIGIVVIALSITRRPRNLGL